MTPSSRVEGNRVVNSEQWPASALPVTRLLRMYGLWYRPCNRQLTQLEGNLSNLIDAAIGSLRVLV